VRRSRSRPAWGDAYLLVAEPLSAGFVRAFYHAVFVLYAAVGAGVCGELLLCGGGGGFLGLVVGLGFGGLGEHVSVNDNSDGGNSFEFIST
jgi:hypothetical protein